MRLFSGGQRGTARRYLFVFFTLASGWLTTVFIHEADVKIPVSGNCEFKIGLRFACRTASMIFISSIVFDELDKFNVKREIKELNKITKLSVTVMAILLVNV